MPLSREQIIEADDIKTQDVPVPEWGGDVRIRGLSGSERDEYEAAMVHFAPGTATGRLKLENVRARLVSMTAVDENGDRLFTDKDVVLLGKKSGSALDRVFEAAKRLSGLSDEDVEELAEGFGGAPSGGSTSA